MAVCAQEKGCQGALCLVAMGTIRGVSTRTMPATKACSFECCKEPVFLCRESAYDARPFRLFQTRSSFCKHLISLRNPQARCFEVGQSAKRVVIKTTVLAFLIFAAFLLPGQAWGSRPAAPLRLALCFPLSWHP